MQQPIENHNTNKPGLIYQFGMRYLESIENNIPELFAAKQWLAWKWHWDKGKNKWTKVSLPINDLNRFVGPTSSEDWASGETVVDTVCNLAESKLPDGLNFAITKDTAFFAIDFDDCRNPSTGHIESAVMRHLKGFQSYTEISPSGTGLRVFGKCEERPFINRKELTTWGAIEYFGHGHTASVTGHVLPGFETLRGIEPERLAKWFLKTFPDEDLKAVSEPQTSIATHNSLNASEAVLEALKRKIEASKQADRFKTLLLPSSDASRGEAELIAFLMFWCGNDPNLIEAFVRRFGTFREKWTSIRGSSNYLRYSIENVLSNGVAKNTFQDSTFTEKEVGSFVDENKNSKKLLKTFWEIDAMPPLAFQIESILPITSFAVMFGEPSCGKSFVALDMAFCIAAGIEFHAHSVKPGRVVYVAAEGVQGLSKRVPAWFAAHSDLDMNAVLKNVSFVAEAIQFSDAHAVDSLLSAIETLPQNPALIVIDTLARCTVGKDENSSRDMGEFIASCDRLKAATNAAVLVLHHTSAAGERERGSTSLRGAADAMFRVDAVKKNETIERIKFKCSKAKDSAPFSTMSFKLESDIKSKSVYLVISENEGDFRAMKPREKELQSLFERKRVLKFAQIKEEGFSDTEAKRLLETLIKNQIVEKTGHGIYQLKSSQVPILVDDSDPFDS